MLFLVAHSCPTLCDPMDGGPPGSSVHGDSPGKNTGVGCHALLQGVFPTQGLNPGLPHCGQIIYQLSHQGNPKNVQHSVSSVQLCPTLGDPVECNPLGFSVHGDSPGKNTRTDCHALLQEIFPTQGSNPGLLHCRWILYHLSHQGSPRILEWAVYPFFRGSS